MTERRNPPTAPAGELTHQVDGTTGAAPPFVEGLAPVPSLPAHLLGFPRVGETVADFELLRVLGSGAFACVYLARQRSLGRLVALKVSRNRGQEAEMLAQMEHNHIVRVFSEAVNPEGDLHCLAMQYVPGTTLDEVLTYLRGLPVEERDGQAILTFLDNCPVDAPALDLDALRQRERLASMDHTEAVCWIGARLAEALAHAHALGILHRDIKPANVLINRYGQPMLADFNVSRSAGPGAEAGLGGTLAYMSPEHLRAFARHPDASLPGEKADLYSLGVLLYQLYTGHLPFAYKNMVSAREGLEELIAERLKPPPPLSMWVAASPALERLMARCLAPAEEDRFESAADLALGLDSAREMHRAQRALPMGSILTRLAVASPLWFTLVLIPLVHVLATGVNITYNGLRIVSGLTEEQQWWFPVCVLAYNAVAWPVCLTLFLGPVFRVFAAYARTQKAEALNAEEINAARRDALTLPRLLAVFSCVGWLPGGILFPWALSFVGPMPLFSYANFLFSFTVSGLIAIVYSVLLMELVVLRALYPALWADARGLRRMARGELDTAEARLPWLQALAVLVPLSGAVLMLGVGPSEFTAEGYQGFRLLVTSLLVAGMVGMGLALLVSSELRRVIFVLTGLTRDSRAGRSGLKALPGKRADVPSTDPPLPRTG